MKSGLCSQRTGQLGLGLEHHLLGNWRPQLSPGSPGPSSILSQNSLPENADLAVSLSCSKPSLLPSGQSPSNVAWTKGPSVTGPCFLCCQARAPCTSTPHSVPRLPASGRHGGQSPPQLPPLASSCLPTGASPGLSPVPHLQAWPECLTSSHRRDASWRQEPCPPWGRGEPGGCSVLCPQTSRCSSGHAWGKSKRKSHLHPFPHQGLLGGDKAEWITERLRSPWSCLDLKEGRGRMSPGLGPGLPGRIRVPSMPWFASSAREMMTPAPPSWRDPQGHVCAHTYVRDARADRTLGGEGLRSPRSRSAEYRSTAEGLRFPTQGDVGSGFWPLLRYVTLDTPRHPGSQPSLCTWRHRGLGCWWPPGSPPDPSTACQTSETTPHARSPPSCLPPTRTGSLPPGRRPQPKRTRKSKIPK